MLELSTGKEKAKVRYFKAVHMLGVGLNARNHPIKPFRV